MVESAFLPMSDACKRALKMTEKALLELGYNVVPFYIEPEEFKEARDIFMSFVANGMTPGMLRDIENECETLMKPLKDTK